MIGVDRVIAAAEELGIHVDPSRIDYGVKCVSDDEFVRFFESVFSRFGLKDLDTCKLNTASISLLTICYLRPPRIAFVWLYGQKAELIVPPYKYFFEIDQLASVLGPKVRSKRVRVRGTLSGCYIPISCEYLVVDKALPAGKPKYVVKGPRTLYVYPSTIPPIPYNLLGLLRLWNGK